MPTEDLNRSVHCARSNRTEISKLYSDRRSHWYGSVEHDDWLILPGQGSVHVLETVDHCCTLEIEQWHTRRQMIIESDGDRREKRSVTLPILSLRVRIVVVTLSLSLIWADWAREENGWATRELQRTADRYHESVLCQSGFRMSKWWVNTARRDSSVVVLASRQGDLTSNNFLAWHTWAGDPIMVTDVRRP